MVACSRSHPRLPTRSESAPLSTLNRYRMANSSLTGSIWHFVAKTRIRSLLSMMFSLESFKSLRDASPALSECTVCEEQVQHELGLLRENCQ